MIVVGIEFVFAGRPLSCHRRVGANLEREPEGFDWKEFVNSRRRKHPVMIELQPEHARQEIDTLVKFHAMQHWFADRMESLMKEVAKTKQSRFLYVVDARNQVLYDIIIDSDGQTVKCVQPPTGVKTVLCPCTVITGERFGKKEETKLVLKSVS